MCCSAFPARSVVTTVTAHLQYMRLHFYKGDCSLSLKATPKYDSLMSLFHTFSCYCQLLNDTSLKKAVLHHHRYRCFWRNCFTWLSSVLPLHFLLLLILSSKTCTVCNCVHKERYRPAKLSFRFYDCHNVTQVP